MLNTDQTSEIYSPPLEVAQTVQDHVIPGVSVSIRTGSVQASLWKSFRHTISFFNSRYFL